MTKTLYNKVVIADHYAREGLHTVDFGADGRFTLTEDADIIVSLKLDDRGVLHISPDKDGAAPLYTLTAELRPEEWERKSDDTYWQTNRLITGMKAGTYRLSGQLENDPSGYGSYIFYAVRIVQAARKTPIKERKPLCPAGGSCAFNAEEGDAASAPQHTLPTASASKCRDTAELSYLLPAGRSASADDTPLALGFTPQSAFDRTAERSGNTLTIRSSAGEPLTFALTAGSSEAAPTGSSINTGTRVQLQNADGTPCPAGSAPAQYLLTDTDGTRLLFSAETGRVTTLIAADDSRETAEEHAQSIRTTCDADGYLSAVYSESDGLQRYIRQADGSVLTEYFSPAAVTVNPDGSFTTEGEPYKTEHYAAVRHADGSITTTITREQAGLPAVVTTRTESEGSVSITKGSGAEAVTRTYTTYDLTGDTTATLETVTTAGSDAPASAVLTVTRQDAGGSVLLSRTTGYGTAEEQTTYYSYDTQNSRLVRITRPDGSYTRYAYDALGRTTLEAVPTPEGGEEVTETTYQDAAAARFLDSRPATITTTRNGITIRQEVHEYADGPAVNSERITTTAAGALQAQTSSTEHYGAEPAYAYAAGKLKHTQDVSGVMTDYAYAPTREHGAAHKLTITTRGADGKLAAGQSRLTERFIAADDTTTFEQESIWSGVQWLLLSTAAYTYDAQHRRIRTTRGNGRISETAWMCCGKLSETDENGIRTDYAYNSAQQLIEETRAAVYDGDTCITPERITEYERDAQGRTIATTQRIGAMTATTRTEYDGLGRAVAQTDALGRRSTTTYAADGLIITQTSPTGAVTTTTRRADGSTASLSGNGQRAVEYSYDITENHCRRTTVRTSNGTMLSQSVEDGFGRTIEESVPSPAGNLITTRSEYNERGQLIRRTRTDGSTEQAPTLYEYDNVGRISRQITALNGTPTPENSAIVEYAYSAEPADDGLVYAVTRTTRYKAPEGPEGDWTMREAGLPRRGECPMGWARINAAGVALTSEEKTLISALDPVLESASIRIDERGNATTTRTEYAGGTARLTLTELPGCAAPARVLSIDGFTTEQTDAAGVTTRAARRYTASGMELTQTDGRGNTTTQVTDIAGRTLTLTDAAGATTTTTYAATSDQPATVTDALGNTANYRYDVRGRKVAEWGTAIQPALYAYDDADRLTALTTFRDAPATNADGSPSQSATGAAAGDTTTWTYDEATGLEIEKRYADGSIVTKTYDSFGNPATETNARGIVTSYEYDSFRNLLLAIRYSDDTEDETFAYNHLGQLTQVTDAAGTRTISYNRYGEAETDSLLAGSMTHTITEQRDELGRSTGYVYAKNDIPQQQTSIGYGADGRVASAGFTHQGEHKEFTYTYLPGTHLLHTLTHPNGLTLTQSYDTTRDLPTDMSYSRADALVVQRAYDYDLLGRPTARNLARYGTETQDTFGYNTRSELTSAHVNSADYSYAYDAIGNRTAATEAGTSTAYTSNRLNQYTAEGSFRPTFDADGNQTLIKTSTGTWNVTYNAKNRPVRFEKADSSIVVECTYDTMGRRATKKVTTNGTLTEHRRFLYHGYLQIACCDLTRAYTPALWFILWDPTQETATRPLAIQKNGTWYTYGWDLTKNICETYRTDARIDLAYTYTPYGEVSPDHSYDQPLRWSSEYQDVELGLVYYNYRHYNPAMGRWMGRDFVQISRHKNIYLNILNSPQKNIDLLGLMFSDINIATAKVNLEWWDDDGGPAGHKGSLDIGQQDKMLSAIEAQYSAICTCGKIVKTEESYTNRDRNGVVISSFWWGKATTYISIHEKVLGLESLSVTFTSQVETNATSVSIFSTFVGAVAGAVAVASGITILPAVIVVGGFTLAGAGIGSAMDAIVESFYTESPSKWSIEAIFSCDPQIAIDHKPTIKWGKSTPQEIHYRASSSRVYQRGNEHYIPLSSFKLSPAL